MAEAWGGPEEGLPGRLKKANGVAVGYHFFPNPCLITEVLLLGPAKKIWHGHPTGKFKGAWKALDPMGNILCVPEEEIFDDPRTTWNYVSG